MSQEIIFYAFAILMTICSVMVIVARNPITSAIFLVGDLFLLAGLYATMDAHFVAAIQVLVYAGAILVLFMFVIMLLNLAPAERRRIALPAPEVGMLVLTVTCFLVVAVLLAMGRPTGAGGDLTPAVIQAGGGNTYALGMALFTQYLWPFELASILILLAIIASVVIAKKDKPKAAASADELKADTPAKGLAHGQR